MHINRTLLIITAIVIGMHALAFFWMQGNTSTPPLPARPEKVIVKTISLQPKKPRVALPEIAQAAPAPAAAKKESISAKEPASLPAKESAKKESPKKNEPIPKQPDKKTEKKQPSKPSTKPQTPPDTAKKDVNTKQKESLEKAKESIGKIQKNQAKISAMKPGEVAPDKKMEPIHWETVDFSDRAKGEGSLEEAGYRDELAGRLKLLLRLPEYGEVRIALTLDRYGKVANLVIISSASEANKNYVKKTLPALIFPRFGNNFGSEDSHTFQVTLRNDFS